MTKEKYMALADIQSLWTEAMKPWINNQKVDKTSVYTKTEVDTMFDEFAGPVYDEQEHGFDFPSTAKMTYDAVDHGFIFG